MVKLVAIILIVGLVLAFPLEYLLNTEFRNQRMVGAFVLVEFTVVAVLVAVMRSRRRL